MRWLRLDIAWERPRLHAQEPMFNTFQACLEISSLAECLGLPSSNPDPSIWSGGICNETIPLASCSTIHTHGETIKGYLFNKTGTNPKVDDQIDDHLPMDKSFI